MCQQKLRDVQQRQTVENNAVQQDRLGPAGWKAALQCALAGRKAGCTLGYISESVDQVISPHSALETTHNCV